MSKMTYREAYNEALQVTLMIYNLYSKLTEYKMRGIIDTDKNKDNVDNLIDLLSECLDKEKEVYGEISRSFSMIELRELCDFVDDAGGIERIPVDFENLVRGDVNLIPRRISNRISDLFRHDSRNFRFAVPDDDGNLIVVSGPEEEEKLERQTGISIKMFREEYLNTIRLEEAFVEDHIRFMLANLETYLDKRSPKTEEQAKIYQAILTSQMMLMFTDYVEEERIIRKRFNFPSNAACVAPFIFDTFNFTEQKYRIIKEGTMIYALNNLVEDFITVKEMDVSDYRDPVVIIRKMYFEAGLRTLSQNEFGCIVERYNDVVKMTLKNDQEYYSEDGIRIVRSILNKVSKYNFNCDITKFSENLVSSDAIVNVNTLTKQKMKRNDKLV